MRIKTTSTRNGRLFYVIKTYYDAKGKEHSITVEKLGNENAIREKYNCDPDGSQGADWRRIFTRIYQNRCNRCTA